MEVPEACVQRVGEYLTLREGFRFMAVGRLPLRVLSGDTAHWALEASRRWPLEYVNLGGDGFAGFSHRIQEDAQILREILLMTNEPPMVNQIRAVKLSHRALKHGRQLLFLLTHKSYQQETQMDFFAPFQHWIPTWGGAFPFEDLVISSYLAPRAYLMANARLACEEWKQLCQRPDAQLEEGFLLLSEWYSPMRKREDVLASMRGIVVAVWTRLGLLHEQVPFEELQLQGRIEELRIQLATMRREHALSAVNYVLYQQMGFRGNATDYYDHRNSLMDFVLARRTGIPISLGALYVFVANLAGLSAHGRRGVRCVNSPGHFLLHCEGDEPGSELYIDAFDGGRIVSMAEIEARMALFNLGAHEARALLEPVPHSSVWMRALRNLHSIFAARSDSADLAFACLMQMFTISPDLSTAINLATRALQISDLDLSQECLDFVLGRSASGTFRMRGGNVSLQHLAVEVRGLQSIEDQLLCGVHSQAEDGYYTRYLEGEILGSSASAEPGSVKFWGLAGRGAFPIRSAAGTSPFQFRVGQRAIHITTSRSCLILGRDIRPPPTTHNMDRSSLKQDGPWYLVLESHQHPVQTYRHTTVAQSLLRLVQGEALDQCKVDFPAELLWPYFSHYDRRRQEFVVRNHYYRTCICNPGSKPPSGGTPEMDQGRLGENSVS